MDFPKQLCVEAAISLASFHHPTGKKQTKLLAHKIFLYKWIYALADTYTVLEAKKFTIALFNALVFCIPNFE